MDNFMDRLAQRLNAQEMIRANVAAETAELEQLRDQVEAYDASLRKMQVLSDTSAENVVRMEAVLDGYSSALTDLSSKLDSYGSELADYEEKLKEYHEVLVNQGVDEDYVTKDELLERFEGMKSDIRTTQDHIEDFSHKENVKVYRNVQAAVSDELEKKTEEIKETVMRQTQELQKRCDEICRQMDDLQKDVDLIKGRTARKTNRGVVVLQVITLLAVAADTLLLIMRIIRIL